MKFYLPLLCGIFIFLSLSCKNSNSAKQDSTMLVTGDNSQLTNNQEKINYLCSKTITHYFSSLENLDTFKIYIIGNSLLESTVHLEIIDSSGKKIYSEKFKSYLLLNFDIDSDTTDLAKENFIKNRIANFFNEDNFIAPAIGDKEEYDSAYSQKDIWDDIHSDRKAIGFRFLIGEEDGRSIAYSRNFKKVVMYFNCC
ncbi:MAG: hypothetical protein ABFD02_14925 [Bacteroidales bacterium]